MYQWGFHQNYTEDNWIHINIRPHIRNRIYTYHTNNCHLTLSDQVNQFDQKQKKKYIKFWNSEVFHVPKIIKNCVYNLVGLHQNVCLIWHNLLSTEKKCYISSINWCISNVFGIKIKIECGWALTMYKVQISFFFKYWNVLEHCQVCQYNKKHLVIDPDQG